MKEKRNIPHCEKCGGKIVYQEKFSTDTDGNSLYEGKFICEKCNQIYIKEELDGNDNNGSAG